MSDGIIVPNLHGSKDGGAEIVEHNRFGWFFIPRCFITERPIEVMLVLSQVVVVRAATDFVMDSVQYEGFSKLFDPIEKGALPPKYMFEFEMLPDDSDGKSFVRLKACRRQDERTISRPIEDMVEPSFLLIEDGALAPIKASKAIL